MKIRVYFFLVVLVAMMMSCFTSYRIKRDFIRSNSPLDVLNVMRIDSVLSVDEWGIPDSVSFSENQYELVRLTESEGLKRINFYEENPGYIWVNNGDTLKSVPREFQRDGWFHITGLRTGDRAPGGLLYKVEGGKRIKTYRRFFF